MSAADDMRDPLAGTAQPLAALGSAARAVTAAIRRIVPDTEKAASGADAIRAAAQEDGTAMRGFKEKAKAAETSVGKAGRTAGTAGGGLRGALSRISGVRGSLLGLITGLGGGLAMLVAMTPALAPLQSLLDKLGMALMIGSFVITAINLVMKANPIGFVTGLLVPVAAYLIDLAINSETGQRIMQQVADTIMKGIPALLKIMGPILKVVETVVTTYFKIYMTVILDVLKVLSAVVGGGFRVMHALVTGDLGKLRGIASGALKGLQDVVRPIVDWFTHDIPEGFTRAKNAMTNVLNGAGNFLTTAAQAVIGVAKAPIEGIIAFANWVIRGLNKIHFSIFGHGFGIHLSEIPMLAEGGVVLPAAARDAARVLPLSALDRQLALATSLHRTYPATGRHRIQQYRETAALGPRGTAEELLFLAALPAA